MKENIPENSKSEIRKNLATEIIFGGMLGSVFGYAFGVLWVGLLVGFLFGLAVAYRLQRAPLKMRYPTFMVRRILLAAGVCILVGLGYALLLERGWSGARLTLAALLPMAAWVYLVVSLGKAIASLDELQRRIQTEAIAIGFAGTVIVCGAYGFLGLSGRLPALNGSIVLAVMVFIWFLGKMVLLWSYR